MLLLLTALTASATDLPEGACTDGRSCRLVKAHPAGTAPDGTPITVLEASHGPPLDRITDHDTQCPQVTWWRTGGGQPPVRLLALCNDGYGASGVGEDSVSVGNNRIQLSRYGGSAWRWSEGLSAQLVPLALTASSIGSFHAAAPDHDSQSSDDLLAGVWSTSWTHPQCGGHTYHRVPIAPAAPPPEVPLGTCSARASADGTEGHVAWGPTSTARDGRLAATLTHDNTLIVDIWDDIVVARADSWVHADHLEIWTSTRSPDRSMDWDCPTDPDPIQQWAIDWSGAVHEGVGAKGDHPRATVTHHGNRTRAVVQLPGNNLPNAITVVFSDADPRGTTPRQERLLATSPVSLRAPHKLGTPTRLRATTCAVTTTPEGSRFNLVPDLAATLAAGRGLDDR